MLLLTERTIDAKERASSRAQHVHVTCTPVILVTRDDLMLDYHWTLQHSSCQCVRLCIAVH
jgi:hypothetical protein